MDKILEVKNLKISFRTSGGKLKAVRDISFDLERGKTLAIVGESGSGKSVTSRAILGILAGNSIVEGGEILYDGRDLLKITEDEMYRLRGDKISMIFQDPLSSLNPIVKIGKQITEAMLLKNKTNRREARKDFNDMLAELEKHMIAALGQDNASHVKELTQTFDKFCIEANHLENGYNQASSKAEKVESQIADFLFKAEKKQKLDVRAASREWRRELKEIKDPFFTAGYRERIAQLSGELQKEAAGHKVQNAKGEEATVISEEMVRVLTKLQALLTEMIGQTSPNFFRVGYYKMKNPSEDLYNITIEELNEKALACLDENFMKEFLVLAAKGVEHSHQMALAKKKELISELEEAKKFYKGDFDRASAEKLCKRLSVLAEESIDQLEVVKDSTAYTFGGGVAYSIDRYFHYKASNPREEARFARQTRRREALIARGRKVEWKVVPKSVYDLDELKESIISIIDRLERHYVEYIENSVGTDFEKRSVDIVDYLKAKASRVVYRVTRSMAKERAIKLMEEVGINEPRMRYTQYPFEFSGGMRQRIVIAIALAADPEILICDEPTTALDVTIQAQILELINRLKRERSLSVIFITHDLGVVANMADDIAVMYAGKIVEYGTADDIFYDPRHPYTWALLSSMPDLDTNERLDAIPGTPPNMIYPPVGDAFAERNKYALQIDFEQQPPMFDVSETHRAATWLLHPNAPEVKLPQIITNRIERMKKKAGGEQSGK